MKIKVQFASESAVKSHSLALRIAKILKAKTGNLSKVYGSLTPKDVKIIEDMGGPIKKDFDKLVDATVNIATEAKAGYKSFPKKPTAAMTTFLKGALSSTKSQLIAVSVFKPSIATALNKGILASVKLGNVAIKVADALSDPSSPACNRLRTWATKQLKLESGTTPTAKTKTMKGRVPRRAPDLSKIMKDFVEVAKIPKHISQALYDMQDGTDDSPKKMDLNIGNMLIGKLMSIKGVSETPKSKTKTILNMPSYYPSSIIVTRSTKSATFDIVPHA